MSLDNKCAQHQKVENQLNHSNVPKTVNYESLQQQKSIDVLTVAYTRYKQDEDANSTEFFESLTKFVLNKINGHVWDMSSSGPTPEDATQDVVLSIWQQLDNFDSDDDQFHSWVEKIAFKNGCKLFSDSLGRRTKFSPLVTFNEETEKYDDNPEIFGDKARRYKRGGKSVSAERHIEYIRKLPDWIQGTDLMICGLIRDGRTYAEIGKFCHISEANIKMRVARMKKRNLAEKAEKEAAKEAAKSLKKYDL